MVSIGGKGVFYKRILQDFSKWEFSLWLHLQSFRAYYMPNMTCVLLAVRLTAFSKMPNNCTVVYHINTKFGMLLECENLRLLKTCGELKYFPAHYSSLFCNFLHHGEYRQCFIDRDQWKWIPQLLDLTQWCVLVCRLLSRLPCWSTQHCLFIFRQYCIHIHINQINSSPLPYMPFFQDSPKLSYAIVSCQTSKCGKNTGTKKYRIYSRISRSAYKPTSFLGLKM